MTNAVSGARPTVDLAYAETYFAARLYADAWTGANANDKVKALEQASILLAGAVDFAPDACARRDDGTAVWHERALAAVCEEALWLLTRDPTRLPELLTLGFSPDVRARRFTVSAVYQTNMKRFDDLICLTDLFAAQKLNGWSPEECTGAELLVSDFSRLNETNRNVALLLRGRFDVNGDLMVPQTITSTYPQVFTWLELLDINVWIILALMIAVAGFTMVSGLLIIILERTQMIGVLKALGARNLTVRHTFLWFAVFIIGRGLLWGNIIGIGIIVLQQQAGIITLDPQTYYVSEAPMELNLPLILLLNVATLLISVLVLVGPSYLVSRIHPARSMRYE